MLTQLYHNIYCNEIPLPNNPLKAINSYIILAPERNLIIDTGFNRPECEEAFYSGTSQLALDFTRTDVLLTHRHADHSGLAATLEGRGSRIYAGALESVAIQEMISPASWEWLYNLIELFGLHEYGITPDDHPGYRYRPQSVPNCFPLTEGALLKYGEYIFRVIDTPGHTPGHIGLYEASHKLFFGGDHVLSSITPNITFWGFQQDSLAQYKESLSKVSAMKIDWLFTAHREIIRDSKTRIGELFIHHERRLAEVWKILADGCKNACQTAAFMAWNLNVKGWAEFPKAQKWFACGEAAAHLEYLFNAGQVDRINSNGTMYYQRKIRSR